MDAFYGRDAVAATRKLDDAVDLVLSVASRARGQSRDALLRRVRKAVARLQEVERQLGGVYSG